MILCRTLGPVDVSLDGGPAPPDLLWRKHLALLIYLARSPRRARSRDHLVGLLWGDRTEAAARHSLSEALRVIRRHAGEAAVETTSGQVRLAPGFVEVDVDQLEAWRTPGSWEAAAELIAGEFLEGFAVPGASEFEDWLAAEREHLAPPGRRGAGARVAKRWRRPDGRRKPRRSPRGHSRSSPRPSAPSGPRSVACRSPGDRAGALELFDRFRARLAEEVGTEPGEETRALVERVRRERGVRPEVAAAGPGGESVVRRAAGRPRGELGRLLEAAGRSARERQAALAGAGGRVGRRKDPVAGGAAGAPSAGRRLASPRPGRSRRIAPSRGAACWRSPAVACSTAHGIGAAPPEALAAFAAVLPEWRERFPGSPLDGAPMPLGRALAETLRAAPEERPVVLAVDDAQWLDPDSASALGAILRDLAGRSAYGRARGRAASRHGPSWTSSAPGSAAI